MMGRKNLKDFLLGLLDRQKRFSRLEFITFIFILTLEFFLLIAIIYFSPAREVWDEPHYVGSVSSVFEYGFSKELLLNVCPGYITGPMYLFVQAFFAKITNLEVYSMRYVSLLFLFILIGSIYFTNRIVKSSTPLKTAFLIMCLPPVYDIAGMALADIIAITFCSIAVGFSIYSFQNRDTLSWIACDLAIVFWALTLLGRQTFLPSFLCLLVFFIIKKENWPKILSILLISVIPIGIVMYVWGGFTPGDLGLSFNIKFLIASTAFFGIFCFLMAPAWFDLRKDVLLKTVISLSLVLSIVIPLFHVAPLHFYVSAFFGKKFLVIYRFMINVIFYFVFIITIYSLVIKIYKSFKNREFSLFYILAAYAIVGTTIVMPTNSSKYIINALPFLVLMLEPYVKYDRFLLLRLSMGGLIGLLSLQSYFLV